MAVKTIDNFNYKGKQQNFMRDSFDTIGEMKDFSENFLPDMFESFCYETQKKYRFNRNNSLDPVLGKWREVIDGSSEFPKATKTKAGVVKVGEGLSVNDGVISADAPKISERSDNAVSQIKDGLYVEKVDTSNFVTKEKGKGLSTNDFTDELKKKLNDVETNVQVDWKQEDKTEDDYIKNKPTKLSEFLNDVDFVSKATEDLLNYYKRTQVYTKTEIQTLINIVNQIAIVKVDRLPTENINPRVFYLVPKEGSEDDGFDEYMYVDGRWEIFGSSSLSLQGYYTKKQCEEVIKNIVTEMILAKVDKVDGMGLSEENFTSEFKTKLESLKNYDDSDILDEISAINGVIGDKTKLIVSSWPDLISAINDLYNNFMERMEYKVIDDKDGVKHKVMEIAYRNGQKAYIELSPVITDTDIGELSNVTDTGVTDGQTLAYDSKTNKYIPKTFDLEGNLKAAKDYTDEQLVIAQNDSSISCDSKPVYNSETQEITYIQKGVSKTTKDTSKWFYYKTGDIVKQVRWIDGVEFLIDTTLVLPNDVLMESDIASTYTGEASEDKTKLANIAHLDLLKSMISTALGNKINSADIVDNLSSDSESKPLSAKQGKVLAGAIATAESNAKDLANATGTLSISHGGTGATSQKGAEFNIVNPTEITNAISDDSYIVGERGTSSSATNGRLNKRPASAFWTYIKSKITTLFASYLVGSENDSSITDFSTVSNADSRQIPLKNVDVSESNGGFRWMTLSTLWSYIKGKIVSYSVTERDVDLLLSHGTYSGKFTNAPAQYGTLIVNEYKNASGKLYSTQIFIPAGDYTDDRKNTIYFRTCNNSEFNDWQSYSKSFIDAKNDKITIAADSNNTFADSTTIHVNGEASNPTSVKTRQASGLWTYIKGKIGDNSKEISNKILGNINAATSDISDTTQFSFHYVTPDNTQGAIYTRTADYIAKYLKTKVSEVNFVTGTPGYTAWASGKSYAVNDVIYYTDNYIYTCKSAHTSSASILPTNTTYWGKTPTPIWGGTIDLPITSLPTGLTIVYKVPCYGGSSSTQLNLKNNAGTSLGTKTILNGRAGNVTTHYAKDYILFLTYDGTYWRGSAYYDANTTYSTITQAEITAGTSTSSRLVTPKLLADNYLNKAGGNMTGNISYTDGTTPYAMIKFHAGNRDGHGISIGGGGLTVIGSGESAANLITAASLVATSEQMYISSDQNVYLYSNCQTIANRKYILFDTDGYLRPPTTGTQQLGSSSYYWASAYINNVYGNLTGNVTGNVSGSSGSCTGNAATATTSTNLKVSNHDANDVNYYPVWANGKGDGSTARGTYTSTDLNYNPSKGDFRSKKFTVDKNVTLQYNSTTKSLDFIFN